MDIEYAQVMHHYFNAVLKLRQNLRQRVQKQLIEHGHADITLEMTQVLYFLSISTESGEANQQEIADGLGKNKSSLTSLIDNLLKRDMLVRRINPENRRTNIISLTEKAKQFVADLYPDVYQTYDIEKIALDIEDIKALTKTLNAIMRS
ncbi:MarR family winged helix-turn-helix transcriptional regulator [Sphingobacterium sp. SG20118]|uniref:MarR family winged helix-turn-helix transcriptional regulator n=1 Tax=unclassified Sphingobacterium TaxID=2609468 RepID=UPI00069068F4|nr:MarR family transcriptional regulator [Sphingobacterium sp. ML3W]